MAKRQKPDRNTSHLAGEYFVAAELYKRGFSVALTIGNAKAIDLFAEKGTKSANIQVKAIRVRRNAGWPIWRSSVRANIIYVFVCLNEEASAPTYFIARGKEFRNLINEYKTRAILTYGSMNSDRFINRWDKIEKDVRRGK
jgi:hypothetical protein